MTHTLTTAAAALLFFSISPASADSPKSPRLYALECGEIEFKDMAMFSDTGELDGKPATLADPCFLIVHPSGKLLWDTGMGDQFVGKGATEVESGITVRVARTVQDQLNSLGLKRDDIDFVSFSHFHFDHTGNASAFTRATWLLNGKEYDAALANPQEGGSDPASLQAKHKVKMQRLTGDHDVFGDGTVKILSMPGHTPGHQVLLVKLAKSGTVLLSGDLYHTLDNRRFKRVPAFNVDRADTLASMDRFERIAENTKARVIVQHAKEDFEAMRANPGYLD